MIITRVFIIFIMTREMSAGESEDHGHSLNEHVETLTKLLGDYNKNIVPLYNNTALNVTVGIIILDMVPLELVDMHYSIEMYFTQQWTDYRLSIGYEDDLEEIVLGGSIIDKIWIPDSFFPSARITKHHDVTTPTHYMSVRPDGKIFYSQRLSVVSRCDMDFRNFPFDKQICIFGVESYAYNTKYLRYDWIESEDGMSQPDNTDMLEFTYDYWSIHKEMVSYNFTTGGNNYFDRLEIRLRFHRNSQWYIINMYIPCILVVMLSWVGFWIDYRSTPARVSLGITTVLTVVTLGSSIRASIPTTDYSKSLDYYVILCLFYVFAALIEYAIVGITDKKWTKRFKDEKKRMMQSRALISKYFHRRNRKKTKTAHRSFVNAAFDIKEVQTINKQNDSRIIDQLRDQTINIEPSSQENGIITTPPPNERRIQNGRFFNLASQVMINNSRNKNLHNGRSQVAHQTETENKENQNGHHTVTNRSHSIPIATPPRIKKSNRFSSMLFFSPSSKEREKLEKTFENAKKKQKKSIYDRVKEKCNDILIQRQRRLDNAHILDRISKKIFIISFLVFNIFYFAFSLSD